MIAAALIINLINLVIGVAEFFISLRIILKLFGANPQAPFVAWVYDVSHSLLWPFLGMFPSPQLENGFVVEFSALIALLVYAFIGYLLTETIGYIEFHGRRWRVVEK